MNICIHIYIYICAPSEHPSRGRSRGHAVWPGTGWTENGLVKFGGVLQRLMGCGEPEAGVRAPFSPSVLDVCDSVTGAYLYLSICNGCSPYPNCCFCGGWHPIQMADHRELYSNSPCSIHQKWNNLFLRSAGSTHRSRKRPLGRADSECVRMGNLLACRALFLLVLCASKGIWWILEQPMSSCMEYHPLFQRVIRLLGMRKILISMSNYGGPTEKKTYLYSSILIGKKGYFYFDKLSWDIFILFDKLS